MVATKHYSSVLRNGLVNVMILTILKCVMYMYVAHNALIGKAVLLPWACKVFLQTYDTKFTGSIKSACVTIEIVDSCVLFSSKWLLNQLIIPIRMSYKCVHMKFGTVLYHRGVDLLVSLLWALGANNLSEDTSVQHHTSTTKQIDKSSVLHNATYVVNDLISEGNPPQENITHYHLT